MYSRRSLLANTLNGLGLLLTDLLQANEDQVRTIRARPQHLPRKAKRCIFLFMQGGVSQMTLSSISQS